MLPKTIAALVDNKVGHTNTIGMSGSTVIVYDDCVLKIDDPNANTQATIDTMRWAEGKLSVPKVLHHEICDGKNYLLMSRIPGEMCCSDSYLSNPDVLLSGLCQGLHLLWQTDTAGCPRTCTLDDLLTQAHIRVEKGLVDMENVEPETFGPNGFSCPEHLLQWLEANKPKSELSLTHGDYCLPNIFLDNGRFSGFIDMDSFGIGEKWRDIALCYRSLKHNTDGHYGKCYDMNPESLFHALDILPDWQQIHYHILLDELF